MPNLDIYLYANGALRLTRHGDRAGGTVLMHVPSNSQFSVPDNETNDLADEIKKWLEVKYPEDVFDMLQHDFADLKVA